MALLEIRKIIYIVENIYLKIQEDTVAFFCRQVVPFCAKAFILKESDRKQCQQIRQQTGSELHGVTEMADLSLYLSNVNVSLGQTMETDTVSLIDTTSRRFFVFLKDK